MLAEGQLGWDWFSLQLSDGREIMYFEVREQDPQRRPKIHGAIVEPDGLVRNLPDDAVRVTVLDQWSNEFGDVYPAKWQFSIPEESIDLTITPKMPAQELDVSIRYREGAVSVEGDHAACIPRKFDIA